MARKKTPKKTKAGKANPRGSSPLNLALPATSANLGPAFDAAALAMNLYITIDAVPAPDFSIRATGRDAQICSAVNDEHLILATYRQVLESQGASVKPLALRIKNDIPIGKGCGSSAAARLAGIAFANHFGRLRWNDDQIIAEASRREHHPDNASACWLGGLAVARMSAKPEAGTSETNEPEVQVISIRPKGKWPLLLAIPDHALSTEEARRVLPAQYSRADAVANIQNSMLLLAAFSQGRPDLLSAALDDRIHQPYRAPLCPLLPALQPLAGTRGILGVALSGAGPSVLIFLDPASPARTTQKSIATRLARAGLRAELLLTSIATRGARG
jgi:homoserine kinase